MQTAMHTAQQPVSHATCRTLRAGGFFQKLSAVALADLTSIRNPTSYEAGDLLFGEEARIAHRHRLSLDLGGDTPSWQRLEGGHRGHFQPACTGTVHNRTRQWMLGTALDRRR